MDKKFALKKKKMNCEEVKEKISIRTVLESFNLFPVKENRETAFFFALDRGQKIPRLSVLIVKRKTCVLELRHFKVNQILFLFQ